MQNWFSSTTFLCTYLIFLGRINLSVENETQLERIKNMLRSKCILDYSYVAALFNPLLPNVTCLGAIISERWIVDNCQIEKGSNLTYTAVKVGLMNPTAAYYNISKSICHKDYARECFVIEGYDTRHMYAARHAICLHRTSTSIKMDYTVHPIGLYAKQNYTLNYVDAVYIFGNKFLYTVQDLPLVEHNYCNQIFFPHFRDGKEMVLTEDQVCIKSHKRITATECCQSQPLLVSNECKLVGVMGWSTACSQTLGVHPWVFTLVTYYRDWIDTIRSSLDNDDNKV
ncbi:hypothetical protein ILUMI_13332 [Ignelater luminosus]|uniref:Peptidase S1 domain-containing protein n=1 Tax=Ignelater luminosus TaxID=2038154 RepID=A0A8K0D110_IGNLU|nr:hypothetical protein ILUMI_13332 [Ignelater luminosus]